MNETTMIDPSKYAVVMWQGEPQDGQGLAEPALLIEFYSDCISIKQDEDSVVINYESIPDLCKLLKSRPKP